MERDPVSSSSLASVGYEPDSARLEVEFVKSGKVFEYYNVPQFMVDRLLAADSIGQFFNAEIRNSYACNPL